MKINEMHYYHMEITIGAIDGHTRKEIIPFKSKWAAEYMAQKYAQCVDVENIDIIDQFTGELVWSTYTEN